MPLTKSNILLFNMRKSFRFVPAYRTYCDQNKLLKRIPPIGGIFISWKVSQNRLLPGRSNGETFTTATGATGVGVAEIKTFAV